MSINLIFADNHFIKEAVFFARDHQPSGVFLGTQTDFPFKPRPSRILVHNLPPHLTACCPLLDDLGIPSRLANTQEQVGCLHGNVLDYAQYLIETNEKHFAITLFGDTVFTKQAKTLFSKHKLTIK